MDLNPVMGEESDRGFMWEISSGGFMEDLWGIDGGIDGGMGVVPGEPGQCH